jgi:hypothetical protein
MDGAVERVLLDPFSIEKLLRTLTARIRNPSDGDAPARWVAQRQRQLVVDLLRAVDDSRPVRVASPQAPVPGAEARDAVRAVLSSPGATCQVLEALAELAHAGGLLDGRHSGTVNAAGRLLNELINSLALPPR